MKQDKIVVVMGGTSTEAEVSRRTGKAILDALLAKGYNAESMELNPKTCIFPISQGIVFLKWRFKITETGRIVMRKRRKSVSRYCRHLRNQKRRIATEELTEDDIHNSFTSWKSHMEMGNSHKVINKVRRLLNV